MNLRSYGVRRHPPPKAFPTVLNVNSKIGPFLLSSWLLSIVLTYSSVTIGVASRAGLSFMSKSLEKIAKLASEEVFFSSVFSTLLDESLVCSTGALPLNTIVPPVA